MQAFVGGRYCKAMSPTRRQVLMAASASAVAFAVGPLGRFAEAQTETSWNDPASWPGGVVPGAGDVAEVFGSVALNTNTRIAGMKIHPGGQLRFSSRSDITLESTGNVEVYGKLIMRPGAPVYTLRFLGVDESAFVGSGHHVLPTDIGLWVPKYTDHTEEVNALGVLEIVGNPVKPWTRMSMGSTAGATGFFVDDIAGWQVGQRIVVAPTRPDDYTGFEERTITNVGSYSGWPLINVDSPLSFDHPMAPAPIATGAEVINLTRNAIVEGTPGGRSHVMIGSGAKQIIDYAHFHHLGPRKNDPTTNTNEDEKIKGRWPVHFHHMMGASMGTTHTGILVTDAGSHAIVPHASHGITLRDCATYNVAEHSYWWDDNKDAETDGGNDSNDILIEHCIAARIFSPVKLGAAGFYLSPGVRNIVRDCVGVGAEGRDGAAVTWPADCCDGEWTNVRNLGHNNRHAGHKVYTNAPAGVPMTTEADAYHCDVGVDHGAYKNFWTYDRCRFVNNTRTGYLLPANANSGGIFIRDGLVDQGGAGRTSVLGAKHIQSPGRATEFQRMVFEDHVAGRPAVETFQGSANLTGNPEWWRFEDCTFAGTEVSQFWMPLGTHDDAVIEVVDANRDLVLRPRATAGAVFRPEWNAYVTTN